MSDSDFKKLDSVIKGALDENAKAAQEHFRKVADAEAAFEKRVDEIAKEQSVPREVALARGLTSDEKLRALYAKRAEAQSAPIPRPIDIFEPYTREASEALAKKRVEMVTYVEQHADKRGIGTMEAQLELQAIARKDLGEHKYSRLEREIREAEAEVSKAAQPIRERITAIHTAEANSAAAVAKRAAAERAELERVAHGDSMSTALHKYVVKYRDEHKLPSYEVAYAKALADDPIARALYSAERSGAVLPATPEQLEARAKLAEIDKRNEPTPYDNSHEAQVKRWINGGKRPNYL